MLDTTSLVSATASLTVSFPASTISLADSVASDTLSTMASLAPPRAERAAAPAPSIAPPAIFNLSLALSATSPTLVPIFSTVSLAPSDTNSLPDSTVLVTVSLAPSTTSDTASLPDSTVSVTVSLAPSAISAPASLAALAEATVLASAPFLGLAIASAAFSSFPSTSFLASACCWICLAIFSLAATLAASRSCFSCRLASLSFCRAIRLSKSSLVLDISRYFSPFERIRSWVILILA